MSMLNVLKTLNFVFDLKKKQDKKLKFMASIKNCFND